MGKSIHELPINVKQYIDFKEIDERGENSGNN